MEYIYGATRVTDIRNKTVDQLKSLKEMGFREISLDHEIRHGDMDMLAAIRRNKRTL